MNTKQIQHLYWRACFGINPKELNLTQHKSKKELVENLFNNSKNMTPLLINTEFYQNFMGDYNKLDANGTDHGTANNVFIISENLKQKGLYNEGPNLADLDENGNLKYSVDFRNIYATILQNWMQVNANGILNNSFQPLSFL